MKKIGYKEVLLEHFRRFKSITSWDAIEMYGMTRLSAVIYNLKKDGYLFENESIEVKNKYGTKVWLTKYILVGKGEIAKDNNKPRGEEV